MKKRIWSLILIVVMVISMAGCGNKNSKASLTGIMEKTETMETGAGTMELSFRFEYPEEELSASQQGNPMMEKAMAALKDGISIKLDYNVEAIDKVQTTIFYKVKKDDSYKKLTDVIAYGKDMYIDVKSLKEAAVSIIPELSVYASAVNIQKDYIKFSEADIKQLTAMSGAQNTDLFSFTIGGMGEVKDQQEVSRIFMKKFLAFFEDAVKEVKPEVITGDEDSVTLSLNKENFASVVEALEAGDLTGYIDEFVKEAEKLGKGKEMVDLIKTSKEDIIKAYKETLKECKDGLKAENKVDYAFEFTEEVTGDEGSRKQDISLKLKVEEDKEKMDLSLEANTNEKTDKKVTEPSSSMGYLEFIQSLGVNLNGN